MEETEEQRRVADGRETAADVGDHKDEEHDVMRGHAVLVHADPRTDQQHRRARGAQHGGDDRAEQQEGDVRRRCGFAFDADVNAAGHHIERPNQRDEAGVFMHRLPKAVRVVQNKKIIAGGDGPQAERHFGVMPQPPVRRKDGRGRHRAQQQRERQHDPEFTHRHGAEL